MTNTLPTIALLGLPTDINSSFVRGSAQAPAIIRTLMHDGCSNLCSESGIDLATHSAFHDVGDLNLEDQSTFLETIETGVDRLLKENNRILSLGGDHAVTYPILRAYARHFPKLTILHFDAHPDLYDEYQGNRYSHACPFARIMEEGLATRLIQVGIRGFNEHQREQAQRFGVETIEMRQFRPDLELALEGPVYISLDLDGLDPAYAPGVSHPEPGGLSTRDVIGIIQAINVPVVGADIVELNPERDINQLTVRVAIKLIKEIVGTMVKCF